MPSLLLRLGVIVGAVVFAAGGLSAFALRSWPAAVAAAVAALALGASVLADRRAVRLKREQRTEAVEAASAAAGSDYEVDVGLRWSQWLWLQCLALAVLVAAAAGAFASWRSGDVAWVLALALLALVAAVASFGMTGVGLAALRAGTFLHLSRLGLTHCTLDTIPWRDIQALDLQTRWSPYDYALVGRSNRFVLAVTLTAAAAKRHAGDRQPSLLDAGAARHVKGRVFIPLGCAAEQPEAVLAAARTFAVRAAAAPLAREGFA